MKCVYKRAHVNDAAHGFTAIKWSRGIPLKSTPAFLARLTTSTFKKKKITKKKYDPPAFLFLGFVENDLWVCVERRTLDRRRARFKIYWIFQTYFTLVKYVLRVWRQVDEPQMRWKMCGQTLECGGKGARTYIKSLCLTHLNAEHCGFFSDLNRCIK